ncbi:MOSC domain-containing protein [Peribacillus kribbensis]|uniref:MOSC domain-containing protein n=1 Tax=Peribacillus kribbensis TaxID=356658 RepID=UPI000426C50D|nr:MOSC domain-containing protein [Peribacillus kribbensis]
MEIGTISSLNIGRPELRKYNNMVMNTAIAKKPAPSAELGYDGFNGDGVANLKFHGGPDRAVCFYPLEHYSFWEKEFDKELDVPAFGENITVENMLEKDVFIGDIFSLGQAVVQITQGRIPCATISMQNNVPLLLKRILDTGYTGYFARVLRPGAVGGVSTIKLIERRQEEITILYANRVMLQNIDGRKGTEAILSAEGLAEDWKKRLTARLKKEGEHL